MGYTQRVTWEQLRSIDSATLNGTYQPVGSGFLHPCVKLKMVNNSNTLVTVSIDGVNDYDVLPPNSFFLYDVDDSGNPSPEAIRQNTQILVKGSAGVGLIYVVTLYIETN